MAKDITGYKNIEERSLKFNEELEKQVKEKIAGYSAIIDTIDGIVWEADAHTFQFNFVSKQAERLLGYPTGLWISDPAFWVDHIHPEDKSWAVNYCIQCTLEKKSHEFEYRMIAKDGRIVWLRDIVTVIVDKDIAKQLRGVMVDITAIKNAEEELRKSEERYRTIIEQASDGIFIVGPDASIIEANNSGCSMLRYSKEELQKMKFTEIIAPENLKADPVRFDALNSGNTIINERRLIRKDGTEILVEISAKLISGGLYQSFIRDITDRKLKEAKLIEQEELLRLFVEHSPASLAMLDYDMRYIITSRRWLTDYNLGGIHLKGKSHYEVFPDIPQRWKDIHQRCLSGAIEKSEEDSFIRADGSIDWVRWEIHPWHKASGEVGGIIIFTEVITERKKAKEKLSNSELLFRTLTVNAPVGIFQTDAQGKTTYVNETWLRYTGMKFNEALGDGWLKAVHPDDLEMLINEWEVKSQKGLRSSLEYRLVNKSGNIRWVSGNAIPLFNLAGEITGHMGTISDITERKNTEQIIRNNEETRKLIMNSALDAIICMDIQGLITVWTPRAEMIFGWKEQEVIGKIMSDIIIPQQYREQHNNGLANYLKTGKGPALNRIFEISALNREGIEFPIELSIIPIKQDNAEFFCAFIRDISDRKMAEQELNESYKAIRKLTAHLQNIREEERTHIAREIHDELGQHLTVLKMDVSWLSKKINKSEDEEAKKKIIDLLGILDGTINTVRRISSELRPSLLDDLGLVAALEWQLDEFGKRSGIETDFIEPDEEVKLTTAIKTGLFRIFQESLTNVARHAGATKVKVSLVQTDNNVEMNITDNGKGFDKHKIADKRTLGLLGMKERTAMIGGTYDIISTPGKGTKVIVTIPLKSGNIKELI